MSKVFVCKSETKPRTYSPIKDAHVFTPISWMKLSGNFQELIKKGVYKKLDYQAWRAVEHEKYYTYRVLTFITTDKTHNCTEIILTDYKFDKEYKFVFNKNHSFTYDANDGSFGSYLRDFYFNSYFGEGEVEGNSFTNGYSWNYMYTLFGYYLPPEAKKYDLPWCAIFYKTPWIWNSCDSFLSSIIAEAISRLGKDMKDSKIQELNLLNIKKEENKIYSDNSVYFNIPDTDTLNKYKFNLDDTIRAECEPAERTNVYDNLTATTSTIPITAVDSKYSNTITIKPNNDVITTTSSWSDTISIPSVKKIDEIEKRIKTIEDTMINKEEKEDNKMKMFNFDFGPIKDNDAIRMSPYGLAVKNVNGTYQAYDKKNGEMMDVDVFNFKADNMFFKIPVAIDAVEAGSVIIFNRKPCFVFGFSEQGDVIVIDIALGEKKTILPSKSPFGNFSFITKIVSLFDNMMTTPSNDNPLGNMWMFAMMDDKSSMKDILPMMMLMNGNTGSTMDPMMLYFMMKDGNEDKDSMLPFLLMMNKK